jgi:hypothetical protein
MTDATLQNLIENKQVDFGKASDDYGKYRPGFPDSFYDRIERFRPLKGCKVMDLGNLIHVLQCINT